LTRGSEREGAGALKLQAKRDFTLAARRSAPPLPSPLPQRERESYTVRLWVIDDGRGVAAQDQARLFDDYAQGSDHGDEVRGGFGLGLASVRRIMALMGGRCGLDPRWRGGAAFFLELPETLRQT
jgi:signal transduction histidine kinase